MAEKPIYRRITIQLTNEQYERLNGVFEWGERNRVLSNLIEWLCDKVEVHGKNALIILLREQKFEELVTMSKKKEEGDGNNR